MVEKVMVETIGESGEIHKVLAVHWRCCNTKFDVDESYMSDAFFLGGGWGGSSKILMNFLEVYFCLTAKQKRFSPFFDGISHDVLITSKQRGSGGSSHSSITFKA